MTGFELFLQYALPIAAFVIGHWHGSKSATPQAPATPPASPAAPGAPVAPANGLASILQALGLPAFPAAIGHGELVQYLTQILAIVQKLQSQLPAAPLGNPPWVVVPAAPAQPQPVVAAPPVAK